MVQENYSNRMLIDKLKSANKKAISFRESGGTPISKSIRKFC